MFKNAELLKGEVEVLINGNQTTIQENLNKIAKLANDVIANIGSIANKVEKEAGKSLVSDTVLAQLLSDTSNLLTLVNSDDTTLDDIQEIVDFIKLNKSTLDALGISSIAGLQGALDGKVDNSRVLTDVPANAVFTDTIYNKPASEAISYITNLQTELNNRVNKEAGKSLVSDTVLAQLLSDTSNLLTLVNSDDTTLDDIQEIVDFIKLNKSTLDALGISSIAGLQGALDTKVNSSDLNVMFEQPAAPTNGKLKDIWFDTDDKVFFIAISGDDDEIEWIEV
jgi:hypothetical protein